MAAIKHVFKVIANKTFVSNITQSSRYISCSGRNNFKSQVSTVASVVCQRSSASSNSASSTPKISAVNVKYSCKHSFDSLLVNELLNNMKDDAPLSDIPDPYEKNYHRCFLCRHNVELNYKNVRLLSQFVSPYTGRIYGREITGLCIPMNWYITNLIIKARNRGYMSVILKDPKYVNDPQPYDVMAKKIY